MKPSAPCQKHTHMLLQMEAMHSMLVGTQTTIRVQAPKHCSPAVSNKTKELGATNLEQ